MAPLRHQVAPSRGIRSALMVRRKDLSYVVAVWLAATAIAGVLAMHGLNPAVFQLDEVSSHDLHSVGGADEVGHAAIGLCVFAVLGFAGLALVALSQRRDNPTYSPRFSPTSSTRASGPLVAGRQRLADLCVLRL